MFPKPCHSCGESSFSPKTLQPARQERVEALLKANEAPCDAEKAALKALLQDAPPTLCQYDEKIALLRNRLQALVEEREKLQMHLDDARKLLHPVRSLPDDVLREIFSHCVPRWADFDHPNSRHYSSLNSRNAPWVLSHVSSRWRRLSISLPSLWSTLACTLPHSTQSTQTAKFAFNLALFLSRSKDCSICVFLRCDGDLTADIKLSTISITLQVSATRWSCLRFDADPYLVSMLSTMCFERLETLDIHPVSSQPSGGPVEEPFRLAPHLRDVRVRSEDLLSSPGLPWAKIKAYNCVLRHLTVTEGARLQSMSQLERLTILGIADTRMTSPLSLQRLTHLVLSTSNPFGLATALPMFTTPALKKLVFRYDSRNQPHDKLIFPSASTVMQNLSSLGIYLNMDVLSNSAVCSAFIGWLREAPNVIVLELFHRGEIPNTLLESLIITPTESDGVLLPNLRWLKLHNLQAEPTEDATIKMGAILSSRKASQTVEVKEGIISRKVQVMRLLAIYTQFS